MTGLRWDRKWSRSRTNLPPANGFGQCLMMTNYYPKVTSQLRRVAVHSTAQIADYPAGSTFGPRQVGDHELIWLLEGSVRWSRQDPGPDGTLGRSVAEILQPGQLAFARRGSVDEFRWDETRHSRHGFLHFGLLETGPSGAGLLMPDRTAIWSMSALPVLRGLCDYLLELSGMGSDEALDRSDHVVALMLDVVLTPPATGAPQTWPDHLDAVTALVRRRWTAGGMGTVEIAELAGAAHLSPGHLHRLFREQFGCGPAHALELIRLARAAISLQRSNATLASVARATGFANPYHFSRRFSAAYGCPPGAFRRQLELVDPLGPVRRAGLSAIAQRLL